LRSSPPHLESLFALSLIALFLLAPAGFAQCTRGGTQLIVDGSFANNCSNWSYISGATRTTTFSSCYGSTAAKFDAGDEEIDQDTSADAGGTTIDTASTNGQNVCNTRTISLGSHPGWVNHHLTLIMYSGFSWTRFHSTTIYVTAISLQQFT